MLESRRPVELCPRGDEPGRPAHPGPWQHGPAGSAAGIGYRLPNRKPVRRHIAGRRADLTRRGRAAVIIGYAECAHDAVRVHRQVARLRVEGTLGLAGALHRPVPSARRADAGRGRPDRRGVLLRAGRAQGHQRRRLGRRLEAPSLRLGVQGQTRRPSTPRSVSCGCTRWRWRTRRC